MGCSFDCHAQAADEVHFRFNPDAGQGGYGFGDWPGELAHNAYNDSEIEPYTGRLEGKDYLRDIQLEHMKILAHEYETEIMVNVLLIIFNAYVRV